jgi:hypothetical protein
MFSLFYFHHCYVVARTHQGPSSRSAALKPVSTAGGGVVT